MQRSESIAQLAKALCQAQGAIENAAKDVTNTFFHSKYADLASIREAIRKPFAEAGLSVAQFIRTDDKGVIDAPLFEKGEYKGLVKDHLTIVSVETMLMHQSGEWLSDVLDIPVWGADAQKVGSASTYGRRYGLQAVSGVAAELDDDGNGAQKRGQEPPQAKATQRRQEPPTPPKATTPAAPQAQAQGKADSKAAEAVRGADPGPHPGDEHTERFERKSEPPKGPTSADTLTAIRGVMKALKAARPQVYATAQMCEQRCVDATGVGSKALDAETAAVFLKSLQDEAKEHGVSL